MGYSFITERFPQVSTYELGERIFEHPSRKDMYQLCSFCFFVFLFLGSKPLLQNQV